MLGPLEGLGVDLVHVLGARRPCCKPRVLGRHLQPTLRGPEHLRAIEVLGAVDDHAAKRFAESGKRIRANVEFYKGAVFAALGIEPDFFTALFTMARVASSCS